MIISIAGTNGSGKSTVVRTILKSAARSKPLYGLLGTKKPEAYWVELEGVAAPLFILGPYVTPTGGVDLMRSVNSTLSLIEKYCKKGHVLFESVITNGCYAGTQKLMEKFGKDSVVAFMDTPLEVCITNVKSRKTVSSSYSPPFDPKNMTNKYKSLRAARQRLITDNRMTVLDFSMGSGVEIVLNLLKGNRGCNDTKPKKSLT